MANGDINIKAGNKADLYDAANNLLCTYTAEVTCTKNYQWLSKDGRVLKDENGVPNGNIEWTLMVNPNGYTFENVVVYDKVLGVPVNPSESQIYFKNDMAFSGSGSHDKNIVTYADTVEYIATKTAADTDGQNYSMKVDLGKISGNDNIVITYTTEIKNYNDYIKYNQPSITNQAWMRFDWPDYVSYSNLKIDELTPAIPNFENKNTDETVDFNFGNELNGKTAVFTVTTKLKNADYYENNKNTDTFYNKADLYSNLVKLSSDDGKVKPSIKVLDKLDPVYNYDSQVMSWKIKVNEDNMALSDPVITDEIPYGLKLDKDSIKFSNGTVIPSGSTKPYYSYITEGKKQMLKIYLADFAVGDLAKEIHFDTVLDADTAVFDGKAMKSYNGDLTVSNTAVLNKSSSTSTVSDSGSIKIKNNILNKTGTVSRNDGLWIAYEVIINQTKSELLENTFIMDILSPRMSFSLPSLELYTAMVNADGTVSKQNKVTGLNYETLILGSDNGYGKDMGSTILKI